jgi:hypothetical protein
MISPLYEWGGLDFPPIGGKKKARQCLNHCVCERVRSTRALYKQPPGLKTTNHFNADAFGIHASGSGNDLYSIRLSPLAR